MADIEQMVFFMDLESDGPVKSANADKNKVWEFCDYLPVGLSAFQRQRYWYCRLSTLTGHAHRTVRIRISK